MSLFKKLLQIYPVCSSICETLDRVDILRLHKATSCSDLVSFLRVDVSHALDGSPLAGTTIIKDFAEQGFFVSTTNLLVLAHGMPTFPLRNDNCIVAVAIVGEYTATETILTGLGIVKKHGLTARRRQQSKVRDGGVDLTVFTIPCRMRSNIEGWDFQFVFEVRCYPCPPDTKLSDVYGGKLDVLARSISPLELSCSVVVYDMYIYIRSIPPWHATAKGLSCVTNITWQPHGVLERMHADFTNWLRIPLPVKY